MRDIISHSNWDTAQHCLLHTLELNHTSSQLCSDTWTRNPNTALPAAQRLGNNCRYLSISSILTETVDNYRLWTISKKKSNANVAVIVAIKNEISTSDRQLRKLLYKAQVFPAYRAWKEFPLLVNWIYGSRFWTTFVYSFILSLSGLFTFPTIEKRMCRR
jgi:hypothetical protein